MAELRYTYLLDVKDMASRQVAQANAKIAGSVERTNVAMRQQGTVAETASRKIQTAGARQAAEWKQVERIARAADREIAQAAIQTATVVTKATEKQVAAQVAAGDSYAQIIRQQKAVGISARETAAAIQQSTLREKRAMEGAAASSRKSATVAAGGMKEKLGGLKSMAGGLAAGFAAFKGLAFIEDSIDATVKLAKATRGLQSITGQDAKTASEWVQLAKQRGLATRQLNMAFITLERTSQKAIQGSKAQATAYRQLGIGQDRLKKSSPEQLIERVADAFQKMGPGAQRAAIAQQIFGRGAQTLLPILGRGGKALRELLGSMASLGGKGVRDSLKFVTEQRKLSEAMDRVKLSVGQAIIPYLTRGAHALNVFIDQMRKGTGTGGQVRKVLQDVGRSVGQLVTALAPVAVVVAKAFGPVAKTAVTGMAQTIRALIGVVRGMVGVVTNLLKGNFAGAWRSVKKIVSSALSGIGGLVKTLMAPVYTVVSGVVGRAIKAAGRLGSGIAGVIRGAVGTVGKAAGAVAGAILGAFRTLARLISGVWDGIVRIVKGAIGTIKSAIGGIKSAFDKVTSIIPGRTGGVAHPGGFRRYQQGGLVPAMLSPGEVVVHGSGGMIVPGQPVAADNVPMLLPTGSAVLTGDGQRRIAAGASVSQAVASQAPHFAAGGWVRTGATVFNDSPPGAFGSLTNGYAELGTATRGGGATGSGYLARALGRRGELPAHYPLEVKIHGRSKVLRKQDRGYGQGSSAYGIDIWRDSWPFFGINSSFKGPALIRPAGGGAGRPGTPGYSVSGYAQEMARRVGRNPARGGILDDAFQQGFDIGNAGGTRAALAREGNPALAAVRGAYRYPATARVAATPATPGPAAGGGGGVGGRSAWRGIGAGGVHSTVRAVASAIMGAFPALQATSTTGGKHASGSYHYRGRAVDIAGPQGVMDRAAAWTRNRLSRRLAEGIHRPGLSVKYGKPVPPGYWGASTWAGHGNHIHVAARRGGWLRGRGGLLVTGGGRTPSFSYTVGSGPLGRGYSGDEFGRYGQRTVGTGATLALATGRVEKARTNRGADAALDHFEKVLGAAMEAKVANLRRGIAAAVKRGGSRAEIKRLQQALSLIDVELGRRSGLIERRIGQRTAASEQLSTRTDIGLRIGGLDPESAQGLTARLGAEAQKGKGLWRTRTDLEKQLRLAGEARNRAEIARIKTALADNMTAILDSRASQKELGRARGEAQKAAEEARRAARLQFVSTVQGYQASQTTLAQTGLQHLGLEQQLAGTYDTGGQARADYIRQQVIPALQAELAPLRAGQEEARRQNNTELAQQMAEAIAGKQNDILQAQLDAQNETASNTQDTANALKQFGGTLGFDFQGSRLTDDLLASGVGA